MQPLDWQNLSVDAYAAHFWDLRYLVRASEVFQREDSVWAALRKLLQSALKNGSPPSNTTVDDTIRTCLQTRLLRSSAFGTPDFYDTRAATINAATLNAPPSGHPPHYPSSATSAPPLTYQPTSLAAPTNSFLTPSSFFSPQAHAAPTQPAPAPSSGLELAPPPAQPAVPSYAHPACHSYTGPRPICYYCGIPGHNSNHCMTLLAHYMREPKCMNVGFDPDVFHHTGKRLLEHEQRRSRRSRQSVPRHSSRDNRDPPPGGAGGSHYRSSNGPSYDHHYRDRSHDRGYGGGKRSSSSHAGPSHGAPPANTASALATYPAPLPSYVPLPPSSASSAPPQQDSTPFFFDSGPRSPYWPQSTPPGPTDPRWTLPPTRSPSSRLIPPKRLSDFEETIVNSKRAKTDHTPVNPASTDGVSRPTTPSAAPLASSSSGQPSSTIPALAPNHNATTTSLTPSPHVPQPASSHAPSRSDTSLVSGFPSHLSNPLIPVPQVHRLKVTVPIFPDNLVVALPSEPTKADLMALVPRGFNPPPSLQALNDSDRVDIIPGPLSTVNLNGVPSPPSLNVLHDNATQSYALQLNLGRCDPLPDGTPLPPVVKYSTPPDPLRSHWIIDSGATCSCTPYIEYFTSYEPCALAITVGNGATLPVLGYGPLSLNVTVLGNSFAKPPTQTSSSAITFSFGLHCPHLAINLLSVRHAISDSYQIIFPSPSMCHLLTPTNSCVEASTNSMGLFSFHATPGSLKPVNFDKPGVSTHKPVRPQHVVAANLLQHYRSFLDSVLAFQPSDGLLNDQSHIYALISDSRLSNQDLVRLWHRRLGHPGHGAIDRLIKDHPELQVFKPRQLKDLLCETCAYAKSRRSPFNSSAVFRARTFLSLVHSDIWGPCSFPSPSGSRYFVVFVYDYSRYTWAYPIQRRSDLYQTYEQFRLDALYLFKRDIDVLSHAQPTDIGTLRSDNAGGYEKLARLITPKYHTRFTFSNAYSPQQNGVAERRIGILVQKIRAMLIEGSLPKFLWAAALDYAAWLVNILPSTNDGQSPYFRVFNTHPPLCYIKTFGCTAFVHIQQEARSSKLDPSSLKAMFVGLPSNRKGYTLMHLLSHQLIYSRDVSFFETEFPAINSIEAAAEYRLRARNDPNFIPTLQPNAPLPPLHAALDRPNTIIIDQPTSNPACLAAHSSSMEAAFPFVCPPTNPHQFTLLRHFPNFFEAPPLASMPTLTLLSFSSKNPSMDTSYLEEISPIALSAISFPHPSNSLSTESPDTLPFTALSLPHLEPITVYALLASRVHSPESDPISWTDAMSRPDKDKWLSAAEDEVRSLISNGTYDLVRRDLSQKVLPCRWVFRLKPGGIYKARLVVKGFMQEHGVDYTEIFAPVVRLEVLRLLFTLVAVYDLECHQMDVKTAFLNGKIDCLIFMEQPPGSFVSSKSRRDYVCRLKKSLYGLKQAPHLWYWTFVEFMTSKGFTRLHKDRCVHPMMDLLLSASTWMISLLLPPLPPWFHP
ncbi:hypothetical protein Ae201684_008720 [Aphanomyces euteiches]|uniref:Integrase catalytic domain-containing protein n=1 Tax=Aphanomyces euteiches TaxID=100861 RepID=A0A6G0X481_9STRA|nr:hypothetical protein Ae201684_008720 [Aphanomyces euteiches]